MTQRRVMAKMFKLNESMADSSDENEAVTFRAGDDGAALIGSLLDGAVLADRLGERAHLEETHEHWVGAGAVEARLVGDDPVAFVVMLEHVVTSWNMQIRVWVDSSLNQRTDRCYWPESASSSPTGAAGQKKKVKSETLVKICKWVTDAKTANYSRRTQRVGYCWFVHCKWNKSQRMTRRPVNIAEEVRHGRRGAHRMNETEKGRKEWNAP